MIRYLYLVLLLCLNQSFSQDNIEIETIKAEGYYCEIQHVRQLPNLCVAASAQMVLAYYGKDIDQKDIKRKADGVMYKDNDKRMFNTTLFTELIRGLKYFKINWQEKLYGMESGNQGLNFIINEIKNKRPVLIDIYPGHTVVVNGYYEKNKLFIITDPNIESPGIKIIYYQDLRRMWNSKGCIRALVKT
jgi:ABC-type bacteriocin/lantibiotic exporter with double-glycine peptidase domain